MARRSVPVCVVDVPGVLGGFRNDERLEYEIREVRGDPVPVGRKAVQHTPKRSEDASRETGGVTMCVRVSSSDEDDLSREAWQFDFVVCLRHTVWLRLLQRSVDGYGSFPDFIFVHQHQRPAAGRTESLTGGRRGSDPGDVVLWDSLVGIKSGGSVARHMVSRTRRRRSSTYNLSYISSVRAATRRLPIRVVSGRLESTEGRTFREGKYSFGRMDVCQARRRTDLRRGIAILGVTISAVRSRPDTVVSVPCFPGPPERVSDLTLPPAPAGLGSRVRRRSAQAVGALPGRLPRVPPSRRGARPLSGRRCGAERGPS